MEEEHRCHTVAVYAPKGEGLSLGERKQSEYEDEEQQQHACRTDETLLLAHGAEDEVGVLLGHELQLGLRAVEEAFAFESARADGYLALMNVVAGTGKVFVESEQHVDAHTLMRLHHVVQHVVGRVEEHHRTDGERQYEEVLRKARTQSVVEEIEEQRKTHTELYPRHVERNDVHVEENGYSGEHQAIADDCIGVLTVVHIVVHHACYEQLYEQQYHELAHRCRCVEEHNALVLNAHNEVEHHATPVKRMLPGIPSR